MIFLFLFLLGVCHATLCDKIFSDGIKLYLPFSGNHKDISGNSNVVVSVGAVQTFDRFGNYGAYRFKQNNYIEIYNSANLKLGFSDFSVGFWINTENQDDMTIYSHGDVAGCGIGT